MFAQWFILGGEWKTLVERTAALAESDAADALTGYLSREAMQVVMSAGKERLKTGLDSVMAEALRATAMRCRLEAFGPEKILAYLSALRVERLNLQLCIAAVLNGMEREAALDRLRGEYA